MRRRTKIVATIGPASSSDEQLEALLDAGMDVARLALAHGTVEDHVSRIRHLRDAAAARNRSVGILVDLPGPKVRTTTILSEIQLNDGAQILLSVGSDHSTEYHLRSDYPNLLSDIRAGDVVGLGDGSVTLRITEVEDVVRASVLHGGTLVGRPGIKVPADRLSVSVPTEEDERLLARCVTAGVDMVAVSFVRAADDVRRVRELAGARGPMIVAKIETRAAVDNLEDIVAESDAVMVARGDLGTECSIEDVPIFQKRIIETCIRRACPVITATQMLESMIHAPIPTRAEASDVANAVLDGTDAVMLSGETAIGHDPVLVVETMARIIERAEQAANNERWERVVSPDVRIGQITSAMTHAAWRAAIDAEVSAILCCTRSGSTARAMASYRPQAMLIGLSPNEATWRKLSLVWGVVPIELPPSETTDEVVDNAVASARRAGLVEAGQVVAVLAGSPDAGEGRTDVLRLVQT